MFDTTMDGTRTLTLVLPESDWKALRAAEPDALGWLHSLIRERLTSSAAAWTPRRDQTPGGDGDRWWDNHDEY